MSRSDESGNYAQARDLIRQIKQYDAQWEGAVLKARTTTNYNYDPLVLPLIEMKRLWREFGTLEGRHQKTEMLAWQKAFRDYQQAFDDKVLLVSRFKTHNAILRNSLAFLPAAADVIQVHLRRLVDADTVRLRRITSDTYDLMLSSLEFAHATTDEKAADILVGLNNLSVNKERLPVNFQVPIDTISKHIELILREQPKVDQLLEAIEAVPIAESLDAIALMLDRDEQAAALTAQRYHFYLLVFSTLLVLLLLYMGMWLMRSYAEIKPCKPSAGECQRRIGTAGRTAYPGTYPSQRSTAARGG
ncbi:MULTISPECIES: DAHL domain-containing protein [Pseudomonas]|uniref:DAHL domain-containing protein n=1 Tax=Pseudomonas asiatica TaxID=2219225 RepID=A0AAJ5LNW2_9PSED|nr:MULTISPECIES: DAHL domain-containing protein [Pseudomonas]MDS9589318.1 DAHL domain-containing protein [Pseudomonas sp. HTZ1]UUC21613.1 hypothetical protein NOV18_12755 [Pseudomonas asiatica]